MLTLIGSTIIAIGALAGIYYSNRASLRQAQRQAVAPKYADVLQLVWDMTNSTQKGRLKERDIAERYFSISQTLIVWGSDRSVCAWRDWRNASNQLAASGEDSGLRALDEFDGLLRSIREDMGHSNDSIAAASEQRFGDLIGLLLTERERPSGQ